MFVANGYPRKTVRRFVEQRRQQIDKREQEEQESRGVVTIPYLKGLSKQFRVHKKGMTSTPFAPAHLPPLINDRSLNTPHQRHYSSYLLISLFCSGVLKDREAPFSLDYVRLSEKLRKSEVPCYYSLFANL